MGTLQFDTLKKFLELQFLGRTPTEAEERKYLEEELGITLPTINEFFIERNRIEGEIILCAAVEFDGIIISGYRHSNCVDVLEKFKVPPKDYPDRKSWGFLTSSKRFVTRKEAWYLAKAAGQIRFGEGATDPENPQLISENLYTFEGEW